MDHKLDALAFAAHPDDIELMCAATLIKLANKGYRTGVIALTEGEMGSRGTPDIRRKEFQNASEIMKLSVSEILDISDGNVRVNETNKLKVIHEIREHRPKLVFVPYWETRHPDHENCSHLVRQAAFFAGLKQIDTKQQHYRPHKIIYYMELYEFNPSFIIDVSETFDEKIQAMQAYGSQFYSPNSADQPQEQTFISTPEFTQHIITRGQYWGNKIGVQYGEPFLIREPMEVEDPVEHFSNSYFSGLF